MILCECGEFIDDDTFKDYIYTSANPSTATIGHKKCGLIYNFVDGEMPKRYSSRKELKKIALRIAEKNCFDTEMISKYLLEVDRLKSEGNLSDFQILLKAYQNKKCVFVR
jgi:hypothetical protein